MITSVEAIAQKLEEKRKVDLEAILSISGSAAISKNEYGITVVDDTNVATSLVFKELHKNKYDKAELLKAIDVNVKELMPNIPIPNLNLVPKPLYDTEVTASADLRKQVSMLTTTVQDLKGTITTLEAEVQTEKNNRLAIEQTNDALANQLNTLVSTIDSFTGQITTSLQKSAEASILKTSLLAQNTGFKSQINSLLKQIDSLNAIINGLFAQLGAIQTQIQTEAAIVQGAAKAAEAAGGATINKVVIATIGDKKDSTKPDVWGRFKSNTNTYEFINGNSLTLINKDTATVTVAIAKTNPDGATDFYTIDSPMEFTLGAGATKKLNFILTNRAAGFGNLQSNNGGKSVEYTKNGALKITITDSAGGTETKTYTAGFGKYHKNSY